MICDNMGETYTHISNDNYKIRRYTRREDVSVMRDKKKLKNVIVRKRIESKRVTTW